MELYWQFAAQALKETLDTLNTDGITMGTYEISVLFDKQRMHTIEKGIFQEALLEVGLTAQFHSPEHIVIQRTYENTRFPRMMTNEFEAAVARARTDQAAYDARNALDTKSEVEVS